MKLVFCMALSAWTFFAGAQDLNKKIDYTTVAIPLSRALDDISKQAGVQLLAQDDLVNEIIVLRLKGVTTDDAMKHIAAAIGGEWKQREQGYDLERDDELTAKLKQQGLQAKVVAVQQMIDKQIKLSGADKPLDQAGAARLAAQLHQAESQQQIHPENYQAVRLAQEQMPDERATWWLLSRIDPKALADMESGERTVFSNKPTGMQVAIEGDLNDIGERWKQEHDLVADELKKLRKPDDNKSIAPFEKSETDLMPAEPARFVVSVQKVFLSQSYQIRVIGLDGNNHAIALSDTNLDLMGDFGNMMAERAKMARANPNESNIPVTPITKAMLEFMRTSMSGGGQHPLSAELRQAMLNPDKTDPLAYLYSEAFLGVAAARNENLVAYPDDSGFLMGMFAGMEGNLKPSLVMEAVTGLGPMMPTDVTEQDGWLTLAPSDRIEALKSRADRQELGELLRSFDKNGYMTLADVGKLAQTVNTLEYPVLDQFLPLMLDQQASLDNLGNLQMVKLYGSLDDGQLMRLKSNLSIRAAELRPEQVAAMSQFAFTGDSFGRRTYNFGGGKDVFEAAEDAEPTETMPDGLPSDTTLSMDIQEKPVYFMKVSTGNSSFSETGDMTNVAQIVYLEQHPERSPNYHPHITSIGPGTSLVVQISIRARTDQQFQSEIHERHPLPGGPWKMDSLPDDVKKKLDAELLRFSQIMNPRNAPDSAPPPSTNPSSPPPVRL